MIRSAVADDVSAVQAVALAAGERFATVAEPSIAACADDAPPHRDDLLLAVDAGCLLVAEVDGAVRGFALLEVLDGHGHLEEIGVHPDTQGRGVGTALLDGAQTWCRHRRVDALTLTTYRDVPWNGPWYERRGFERIEPDDLGPELRARVAHEATLGLDPALRVCLRRPVPSPD